MFFEKTRLGTYRSPFSIEKSNAGQKFSIEDVLFVERSQKSVKGEKKISKTSEDSWCLGHFFFLLLLLLLSPSSGTAARAGSTAARVGGHGGTGETWSRHGQDTGKIRARHGQDTDKTWARHGQDTGKTRTRHGQDTGKTRARHGQYSTLQY